MLISALVKPLDHFLDTIYRIVLGWGDFGSDALESNNDSFNYCFVQLRIVVATPGKLEREKYMVKHILKRLYGVETRESSHREQFGQRSMEQEICVSNVLHAYPMWRRGIIMLGRWSKRMIRSWR